MPEVGEYTLQALHELVSMVAGSHLLSIGGRDDDAVPEAIMPEAFKGLVKSESVKRLELPHYLGQIRGREVRLEFTPATKPDSWWLTAFTTAKPGELDFSVTRWEVVPQFQVKKTSPTFSCFKVGREWFDKQFQFCSNNEKLALKVLDAPQAQVALDKIGMVERFAIDTRFVRVTHLLDSEHSYSAAELLQVLEKLVEAIEDLENWPSYVGQA